MRELKFRFWGSFEGFEFDYDPPHPKTMIYGNEFGFGLYAPINELMNDKNIVVMQYIGLKDKNNKEIYEGDIVRIVGGVNHQGMWQYDVTGIITFSHGCFFVKNDDVCYSFEHIDSSEVLGNIYENPNF